MTFHCSNCSANVSPYSHSCGRCGQLLHPLTADEVSMLQQQREISPVAIIGPAEMDESPALCLAGET